MCGICGFITLSPLPDGLSLAEQCRIMADTLSHRGPDGHGIWIDEDAGVALGHRRLAIIDLSDAGSQPMVSQSKDLVITYNGEIYNFMEIRSELELHGHKFRGSSDTEVLLTAISHWGVADTVKRCIGMFAFALWDKRDRSLKLVRDRVGIKPLYYGHVGNALVFASEIKPFHSFPGFPADIDLDSLASFLRFAYVPTQKSIFKGVQKVNPGEILTFHGDLPPTRETYWSMLTVSENGITKPFSGTHDEAVTTLDSLLTDAVRRRMVADVPLGAFLSGGIDSSLITAIMQSNSDRPVRTFSIGFREPKFDETPYARAVAKHLGTDHTELYVTPSMLLDSIPDIARYWDEPFADSSQVPTLILSKLTRNHVTVCLSGDGGDELFLGYERYRVANAFWNTLRLLPRPTRIALAHAAKMLPNSLFSLLGTRGHGYKWRIDGMKSQSFHEFYRFLLSSNHAPESMVPGSRELVTSHLNPPQSLQSDAFRLMAYLDATNYLPNDILTKIDRASMAFGLEARVPLLDHRVVEFACTLPSSLNRSHPEGKAPLRALLARYVPKSIFNRPKAGFTVPMSLWLKNDLRDWCETMLDPAIIKTDGYLDHRRVSSMWRDYLEGQTSHHSGIWCILMFQSWLRAWK